MIERQENSGDKRDSLASWLRPDGSRRYVPATTICWRPRKPQYMRAVREGCEVTLRCYDCPGCREFEAQRLARRIVETYRAIAAAADSSVVDNPLRAQRPQSTTSMRLFALRIYCPKDLHASTSRRIHRWRGVEIEPYFFRAGVDSFIVLSREPSELVARLGRRRIRFDVRPVGNISRARSFRDIVRGLIVTREAYGENINRFYGLGLAPADKEKWEVKNIGVYKPYDRSSDARVISESLGRLVPPALPALRRGSLLRVHNILSRASSPEQVDRLMPEVRALLERVAKPLIVSAVPKSAEELERNREFNIRMARNESARTDRSDPEKSSPPFLKGEVSEVVDNSSSQIGRPMSSIHSSGAPPPRTRDSIRAEAEAAEASEKHRAEFLAQRSNKKLHEAIERLRELVARRQKYDGDN